MTNKYVDGGIAFPVFRGPYLQKDVNMAVFLFSAEYDKLARLCKQYLIEPSDHAVNYAPALPAALLVYADMKVSSLHEEDRRIGRIPQTEVSFWIPVVAMKKIGGAFVPHHLAWFVPYLFTEDGNSIATGREVYGFNKLAGRIHKPMDMNQPEFALDVMGVENFGVEIEAEQKRLFEVRQAASGKEMPQWESWEEVKSALDESLAEDIQRAPKNLVVEITARLVNQNVPFVFLKQFRDAMAPDKAVHQSILEAPIKLKKFHHGGFLSGDYQLRINRLDSHPLVEKLGLKLTEGVQSAKKGIQIKVDFELGLGKQIWPSK